MFHNRSYHRITPQNVYMSRYFVVNLLNVRILFCIFGLNTALNIVGNGEKTPNTSCREMICIGAGGGGGVIGWPGGTEESPRLLPSARIQTDPELLYCQNQVRNLEHHQNPIKISAFISGFLLGCGWVPYLQYLPTMKWLMAMAVLYSDFCGSVPPGETAFTPWLI